MSYDNNFLRRSENRRLYKEYEEQALKVNYTKVSWSKMLGLICNYASSEMNAKDKIERHLWLQRNHYISRGEYPCINKKEEAMPPTTTPDGREMYFKIYPE